MKNGFRVIDGDGHMQEPMDMWANYTDPAYKERIPKNLGLVHIAIEVHVCPPDVSLIN